MPFANQVSAGVQFCRNIMQSLGFISGVSGWQLQRNGDAQFNDVTLTGTFAGTNYVINSNGVFFYSTSTPQAGTLVASVANGSSTDSAGNAYIGPGPAAYHTTGANSWYAVLISQGFTAYYFATSSAGPWTVQGATRGDITTGVLTLQASSNIEAQEPVALDNQGADPATPSGAAWLYGKSGQAKIASSDGNAWTAGQRTLYSTAAQTISTTTAAAVTFANGGPTLPVAAGAYRIRVRGTYLENQSAGTPSFEIVGPATSNVEITTVIYSVAGAAAVLTNRTTALGTPFTGPAMASLTRIIDLEGLIVFSAAGNVGLSALTSAAADTFNIQAGTYLSLTPVA